MRKQYDSIRLIKNCCTCMYADMIVFSDGHKYYEDLECYWDELYLSPIITCYSCRRNAPDSSGNFPEVQVEGWCGEWLERYSTCEKEPYYKMEMNIYGGQFFDDHMMYNQFGHHIKK